MSPHRTRKLKIAAAWCAIFLAGAIVGWRTYVARRAQIIEDLIEDTKRTALAFDPGNVQRIAGLPEDRSSPIYQNVKDRLRRLRTVGPDVRLVYLVRFTPDTGRAIFLADSRAAGTENELPPGADYFRSDLPPALEEAARRGEAV